MHHLSKVVGVTAITVALTTLSGCQTLKNSKLLGGKDEVVATKAEKSEQGYYQAASDNIKKGNFAKAISQLNDLRTFYPVGDYSEQALLDLMYAQYQHGDYLDAIASADRFIQSYPSNPQVDYAYYVRGISNMQAASGGVMKYTKLNPAHRDMSYSRIAFNNFQQLINRFPNSAYAPDAALRMRYIYNQLAESEMDVARWYIKRKAYVAAANRAKWVFQYYPQSEAIPESIATIAYSYDKLGMTDTANQYKQLLRINYPALIDARGNVKLDNTRTGSNWLNKATLGVLGQSSKNAAVQGLAQQSGQYSGNTKPQVIQTSIQQAAAMRLPSPATTANDETATRPRDTTIGLGLPPDNTSQVK
ncbi:transporter [Moraxella osloensis]|uniref:Outer membrane protein assembly factor BamD n=1 Tax=Faucicola osloensis TaxID=34062 RepID=A0AA91FI37_FAUOS|nr:outer membrane protein assembly factor BamD [Moraxella osloensis]OBX62647.1 transporter [Moraxella osloensis]